MKKLLAVILAVVMMAATLVVPVSASFFPGYFSDIDAEHFGINTRLLADQAYEAGIVRGDDYGHFRPWDTVTHFELEQMAYNAFCYYKVPAEFDQGQKWYEPAHNWAYAQLMKYIGDGASFTMYSDGRTAETFYASTPATYRYCVAVLYAVYLNTLGKNVAGDLWEEAVAWATANGYGETGNFRPYSRGGEYMTRIEALQLFMGLYDVIIP